MMGRAVRARAIKPLSPTLECPECNCWRGAGSGRGGGRSRTQQTAFPATSIYTIYYLHCSQGELVLEFYFVTLVVAT